MRFQLLVKRRCRLIEYQELGRPSERPRYLDHLSTREGKIRHEFIWMDILAVDAGEQGFGEAALGARRPPRVVPDSPAPAAPAGATQANPPPAGHSPWNG